MEPRIEAFHIENAEFDPTLGSGIYGRLQDWPHRRGRSGALGTAVSMPRGFSPCSRAPATMGRRASNGGPVSKAPWRVREGAAFINDGIIATAGRSFNAMMQGSA